MPLRAPFRTAAGELTYREGLVLRLATDVGIEGLGEASPHPALGPGGVRQVQEGLEAKATPLLGAEVEELDAWLEGQKMPPALACAIDTAACDALARARGVSVARLLADGAPCRLEVPVNATIGVKTAAQAASQAAAAREAGFACVKLKVGMGRSIREERRRVAAVRRALGPEVRLRIDANGAWRAEEAVSIIQALEEYGLEMVEQPVPAAEVEGMARVRAAVGVPIAADEAVTDLEAARRLLECGAADVLVVKPMVVGGPRPARRIAELAAAAGAAVVVTTSIDAGIGTAAALHLAATLPPDGPACGLATASLLVADIITRPLLAQGGRLELPQGPGLGIVLDEGKLARYGGREREVS